MKDEQPLEEHEAFLHDKDEDQYSEGLLEQAIVEDLVTDIMGLMSENEELPEDESEIPPENEDQEALAEEAVDLVGSPFLRLRFLMICWCS